MTAAETCTDCGTRCDDCGERMCATWGPEPAITCGVHRYCTDCDRDNRCRECRREREAAA